MATKIEIKKQERPYFRQVKFYELEVDGVAVKASKTWEQDNEFGNYETEHEIIEDEAKVEAALNDEQLEALHEFLDGVE